MDKCGGGGDNGRATVVLRFPWWRREEKNNPILKVESRRGRRGGDKDYSGQGEVGRDDKGKKVGKSLIGLRKKHPHVRARAHIHTHRAAVDGCSRFVKSYITEVV